jgi:adenosylcobinamide-phosphate synthase
MSFIALIIALLLEQARPLASNNFAFKAVRSVARWLEHNFNAGEHQQGAIAWYLLSLGLTLGTAAIYLASQHLLHGSAVPLLGLLWDVVILYFTLGFRHFSHYYTDIQMALANNDLARARELLTHWKRQSVPEFSAVELGLTDVSRIAIEEALLASHRHVFGVFFWFIVLPGPSGAVLYRIADYLARAWNYPAVPSDERFGDFARKAFAVIDWIPVRLTAIGFAIVGNFEDAYYGWSEQAARWSDPVRGILLSSGAGALGVRLGDAHSLNSVDPARAAEYESLPGVEASPAAMQSAVGLVWRSMVLWLLLLFLMWAATWFAGGGPPAS